MSPILSFIALLFVCNFSFAQKNIYWQQAVHYNIQVALDDKKNQLHGFESIDYTNHSPDTLHYIWMHLWANAFKNDHTAYSENLLQNRQTDFYFSSKDKKGYINQLQFRVDDRVVQIMEDSLHQDIIKLLLPQPLSPNKKIRISTPFHIQLPYCFYSNGHKKQHYQASIWHPTIAVYDNSGWHPMPYIENGGKYNEIGSFEVQITLPENYVVATNGQLENIEEQAWLNQRSYFTFTPIRQTTKVYGAIKTIITATPPSATNNKTLNYKGENLQEFSWVADKMLKYNAKEILLNGKKINIEHYYHKNAPPEAITEIVEKSLEAFSNILGEYPYQAISIVETDDTNPLKQYQKSRPIVQYSANGKTGILQGVAHQWVSGAVGINTRKSSWLADGIANYLMHGAFPESKSLKDENLQLTLEKSKNSIAINTASDSSFLYANRLNNIAKTSHWLEIINKQALLGNINTAIKNYYSQWKFKHPSANSFQDAVQAIATTKPDSLFSLINNKKSLSQNTQQDTKIIFPFGKKLIDRYTSNTAKNLITIGPAIGFNHYDKLMLGALVANPKLPPSSFQFFASGLYATATRQINLFAIGKQSFYTDGLFKKIDVGLNISRFSYRNFRQPNTSLNLRVLRWMPSVQLYLKDIKPMSTKTIMFEAKSFIIHADSLAFKPGGSMPDPVAHLLPSRNIFTQLNATISDNRKLYPYEAKISLEHHKLFSKITLNTNQFFNYPDGGGMIVRLFAGKFFYNQPKSNLLKLSTRKYHLNMSGPTGAEDYTFSNYFIGRSQTEGFFSRQLMIRDGGFKISSDNASKETGLSGNWIVAINLSTTIPEKINPFSVLPFKMPLKIYGETGTYAEAWKTSANQNRFLFTIGLQLSLAKNVVNIYLPLLYSNAYKEYLNSTSPTKNKIFRAISFSIDIPNKLSFNHLYH